MRLSPSGRRVAYIEGYGLSPPQPEVTVDDHGVQIFTGAAGHSPRWSGESVVVYGPQDDGPLRTFNTDTSQHASLNIPSGNVITAAAGHAAVSRTDPIRTILAPSAMTLAGVWTPALSDNAGFLAVTKPDVPSAGVSTVSVGLRTGVLLDVYVGAPSMLRFGSNTLVWEDAGRLFGIVDVSNNLTVVPLHTGGWSASKPVPLWSPQYGLFVQYVRDRGDEGEIVLAEWGSLASGAPKGYILGTSTGSAFDHDVRMLHSEPEYARTVYFSPFGQLVSLKTDLRNAMVSLSMGDPVPPDPPDPEPPDPPDPPDPPPSGDDMTYDDIHRYMGDLTNDLLFGAIQRWHNEVLPRDRPKDPVIKAADDSDFSTHDVTTGGAMGFFVRSYVSEFIIARDKGRDAPHASGDGYDAAFKAYTNAVNPPPPIDPIEPGPPPTSSIGVEGRFFVRSIILALALLVPSLAHAQNPNVGPNDSFAWNQTAPDLTTAQNYVYKYYLDGAVTGSVWANVTCTGTTAPYTCQARTPSFSNGTHTITITAANSTGESAPSVPFSFVFGNPPAVPNNIRVVKGAI